MDVKDLLLVFNENELKSIIEKLYIEAELSTTNISKMFKKKYDLDVSHNIIYSLLNKFNIPIRSISDAVSLATSTLDYSEDVFENHPITLEVMDGLLISDGSISSSEGQKYHRFSIASSQQEFMIYCHGFLIPFNPSVVKFKKALGYGRNKGYEKSRYSFCTAFHPLITKQRLRWYEEKKKIIPKDIKITPLMLRMWYYGDGSIVTNKETNTCLVRLSTDGFDKQDVDFVIKRLKEQIDIESVNSDNRIRINANSISTFFNYIGKAPYLDCYSYKFDVDEWRFWKGMKTVSTEINLPYNRLSHLVKTNSIIFNRSPGGKKVLFTESQVDKLRQLHGNGLLEADPRKNSAAVTKGTFAKKPDIENRYKEVKAKGFPYVTLSESEKIVMFNRLNNIPTIAVNKNEINVSYRDNDLAIYYHPHLFDVKSAKYLTPIETFNNNSSLMSVVERLLNKNADFSNRNLRYWIQQIENTKRTSVFPVRVAKTIYTLYGKDNMRVLDPCAGYSSRLIGFYSNARGGTYHGIEPCQQTYGGLLKTQQEIEPMALNHSAILNNECAEDLMPKLSSNYDMIFTSPPYFDLEKYSDEDTQSYKRYKKYEEWLDKFLFVIVSESYRLLNDDGVFLLNVADCRNYKIVEHVEMFAKKMFRLDHVLLMIQPARNKDYFTEPILVLKKY